MDSNKCCDMCSGIYYEIRKLFMGISDSSNV